jgi:hypothetical protein
MDTAKMLRKRDKKKKDKKVHKEHREKETVQSDDEEQ